MLQLDLSYAVARAGIPAAVSFRRWVAAALQQQRRRSAELSIRVVDSAEGRELNRQYRGKDYATNVLTFAYSEDESEDTVRADLVLCTDVLCVEAQAQNKPVLAHVAHLVVHGVMHAQGYDHESEAEAEEMEELETAVLARLGFDDPYAS